jgi:hypothetical protein
MVRLIRRTFLLVLTLTTAPQLNAQQTAWKVGLAQTEITPEQPMLMDGYAGRRQPFEGVESPIHATDTSAMAINIADGTATAGPIKIDAGSRQFNFKYKLTKENDGIWRITGSTYD